MVAVGWVEARNPTVTRVMLGFAKLNPTYQNMGLSAVLSVSQDIKSGKRESPSIPLKRGTFFPVPPL
jgi:hypothetical protein